MIKYLPLASPPRYCQQCARTLQDSTIRIPMGYDPMTAQQLPDRVSLTRRCTEQGHDTWHRGDDGWVMV